MTEDPTRLLQRWDIEFKTERRHILIPGSPERCLYRTVVEDIRGLRFVLECIPDRKLGLKQSIAGILEALFKQGLEGIVPYRKSASGEYILEQSNRWWQLVPYIEGVELCRPGYVYEGWRGPVLANFLIELEQKAICLEKQTENRVFSIVAYIEDLVHTMEIHASATITAFIPALSFLRERFYRIHDQLPVRFCHGDYHPLNVIWGPSELLAVIDWEFSGYKAEPYDMANLIGCIGIEDPNSLEGELVRGFIEGMKKEGGFCGLSWEYLPDFIMAMRFAWLSEWLRKKDVEMIRMEAKYLSLLLENRNYLKSVWRI